MPKEYVLKMYNSLIKKCDFCGEPFRLGDVIVRTTARRYHAKCFEKLLH
ncbi:MAG: hypothetical protein QXL71_09095 [Candidatus Bathyarchaeia archaeon]